MDLGLIFGAIAWAALCISGGREVLRGYQWDRATAVVVGYKMQAGDPNDGALLIEFYAEKNKELINASLWNNGSKAPFPHCWPIGSNVEIAYNPLIPAEITWPRSSLFVALCYGFFSLPFLVWLWHAH